MTNKNYVKEFMDDNRLKINVEFPVKSYGGTFHFDDDYILEDGNGDFKYKLLIDLLTGITEIEPLPFSPQNLPKSKEEIWAVTSASVTYYNFDSGYFWMFALVASGNAFRTQEEAEEAAPRIRKEQGMIKE